MVSNDHPAEDRSGHALTRLADALALLLLMLPLYWFLWRVFYQVRFPFEINYGEGAVLNSLTLLMEHGTYFFDIRQGYPYVHGAYPPLFFVVSAVFGFIWGPSLAVTRAVASASTLTITLLVFLILLRVTRKRLLSALFALLVLAPRLVQGWGALGRVDTLACALSLAGMFPLVRAPEAPSRSNPWFVLSLGAKHSYVAAPLTAFVASLFDARLRGGLVRQVLLFVIPLFSLILIGSLYTHGEMIRHMGPYLGAAQFTLAGVLDGYAQFFELILPLCPWLLAGILFTRGALLRAPGPRALFIYWVFNVATVARMGLGGASDNHLLEPFVATLMMTAVSVHALQEQLPQRPYPLLLRWLPALSFMISISGDTTIYDVHSGIKNPEEAEVKQQLSRFIAQAPGPVLSEEMSLLLLNHRPVLLEPAPFFPMAVKGIWDSTRFMSDCNSGHFALIVSEWRFLEIPGFRACLDHAYTPLGTLGLYTLYQPRPPAPDAVGEGPSQRP